MVKRKIKRISKGKVTIRDILLEALETSKFGKMLKKEGKKRKKR